MKSIETEKDIEILRQLALQREQALLEKISALEKENEELRQSNAKLQRMLFGKSSEKRPPETDENTSKDPSEPEKKKKRGGKRKPQKGHGPRPQPALEIQEEVHKLDDADRICLSCGDMLEEWEGQFEESEEITVVPSKVICIKHKRQKYKCKCNGCVETALGPTKLHKKARYSIAFALNVVFDKYSLQLPLERQVRAMGYDGLIIDSQTLWDQTWRVTEILRPAYERLLKHQWSMPLLGGDETTWRLMENHNQPKGSSKQCYAWSLVSPKAAYHCILQSRSAEAGSQLLNGFRGILMTDGYAAYPALAKDHGFTLVHCWAHVRREFIDIEKAFPKQVGQIVALIRKLYVLEKKCAPGAAGNDHRRALRTTEARAIVKQIEVWAKSTVVLPESGLGKAIQYMQNRWAGLIRFLDDPRIPLDNNATERALRVLVLGRKNHYGSHSERGLLAASVLYSLIDTAALEGLNPRVYLEVAIRRGLSGQEVPLPHELADEMRSRQIEVIAA